MRIMTGLETEVALATPEIDHAWELASSKEWIEIVMIRFAPPRRLDGFKPCFEFLWILRLLETDFHLPDFKLGEMNVLFQPVQHMQWVEFAMVRQTELVNHAMFNP